MTLPKPWDTPEWTHDFGCVHLPEVGQIRALARRLQAVPPEAGSGR